MKIYQIHEYGGFWEDAYDCIIASYLSEEKAIVRKEELEIEQGKMPKCNECPLYFCPTDCNLDCETEECKKIGLNFVKENCPDYEQDEYREDKCANYCSNIFDDSFYRIEEVEVIE